MLAILERLKTAEWAVQSVSLFVQWTVSVHNKKLHHREEHSASFMLSRCTLTFLGRKSVDGGKRDI